MSDEHVRKPDIDIGEESSPLKGLTINTVIAGILGILALIVIEARANLYKKGVGMDLISAPSIGAMVVVMSIILIDKLMGRLGVKPRMAQHELIMIYIMTSFAGLIIAYPYYLSILSSRLMVYAQMTLRFTSRYPAVAGRMSPLLVPLDIGAVDGFFRGGGDIPWELWIVPFIMWTLFFMAFLLIQISIACMVRKHWTDYERLSYPMTTPIHAMVSQEKFEGYDFWKEKWMWLGAIISIVIVTINALQKYFPGIPLLKFTYDLENFFPEGPWRKGVSTSYLKANIDPLYIGLAYLFPLDLLFSFWFFFGVITIRNVIMASLLPHNIYFNWTGQPSEYAGGFLAIALVLLWTSRQDIFRIIKAGFSKSKDNSGDEPFSPKASFWIFIVCFAFLTWFYGILMDSSIWYGALVLLVFLGTALTWARVRSESGLPQTQAGAWFNSESVAQSTGKYYESALITGLCHQVVDYGAMGCQIGIALEAYKLGDKVGIRRKSITAALLIAFVIAVIIYLPLTVKVYYEKGGYAAAPDTRFSWYDYSQSYVSQRGATPNAASYVMGLIAFAITFILYFARLRLTWWFFHPIGFAMAKHIYGPRLLWFPFLIAWAVKFLAYRWSGREAANFIRRIALGMVAGSIIAQGFWSVVGLFFAP